MWGTPIPEKNGMNSDRFSSFANRSNMTLTANDLQIKILPYGGYYQTHLELYEQKAAKKAGGRRRGFGGVHQWAVASLARRSLFIPILGSVSVPADQL